MTHKSHIYVSTARGILRTFHVGCNCFVDSIETLLLHENAKQDMGRKRPTDFTCHRARSVDWSVCERSQVIDVTARMPRDSVKFGIRQVSLQLSLLITFYTVGTLSQGSTLSQPTPGRTPDSSLTWWVSWVLTAVSVGTVGRICTNDLQATINLTR